MRVNAPRRPAGLTLVLALLPPLLAAQDTAAVKWGDRVRLLVPGHLVDAWILAGGDSAGLLLTRGARDTLIVPLDIVRRFEVSRGTRSAAPQGAGVGAILGAIVGAWVAGRQGPGDVLLRGAGIGIAAGVGAGALIGTQVRTDRWQVVPLDRVRVGLRLTP
jgi:hypothetical protein